MHSTSSVAHLSMVLRSLSCLALVDSAALGVSFLLEQLTKNTLSAEDYRKPFTGFSDLILATVSQGG